MKPLKLLRIFCALMGILLISGCATPKTRLEEDPALAKSLSKTHREAALRGEILEGMNKDAVWLAMGEPSKVVQGREKGVKQEAWVYSRLDTYEVPGWDYGYYSTADGRISAYPHYRPAYRHRSEDYFEVKFENGKVVGWQGLR